MAKATAICTCKHCGAEFKKTAIKHNRSDADSWEAWAVEAFDICPDCSEKRRAEKREESNKAYGLPEIVGVSEKQIQYASNLRDKFMAKHKTEFDSVKKAIDNFNNPVSIAYFAEQGKTPESHLMDCCKAWPDYAKAYVCITETQASKIIDKLA